MMTEDKDPSQVHSQQQQQQHAQQQAQQEQPPPPQPPPPTQIHPQHTAATLVAMQAAATAQAIVPQGSPQVGQQQNVQQATMTQVMQQGPQPAHSPHGVAANMPPQSPQLLERFWNGNDDYAAKLQGRQTQAIFFREDTPYLSTSSDGRATAKFYVQASLASGMQQAPPAIAPAPGPQANTTTVSALHQPLQHHLAPQTLTHPGVSPSPMTQFSPQVQVIQGGIPGGYLQQVYQNAQGQLIMPSNITLQTAAGMNATQIQPNALNGLNQPIQFPQVITAATGKPFQGQIAPHMLATATGKAGVLQGGQTGYSQAIPTTGSQTLVIGQLPVGVISSQQHNILPAHSGTHKSTDMQKQQAISWTTQGALHSPALLAQNQPIFIRGGQPGQDNVFISNPQPQTMHVPNSMMPSLQSMQQGPQAPKPRSGMEMPANIQPKAPNMRPAILPSNQIRPGASVSTQTAGQQLVPGHISAPRAQNKIRGKSGGNRASPAIAGTAQIAAAQVSQNTVAVSATVAAVTATPTAVAVNAGTQVMQQQAAVTPVTMHNPAMSVSAQNKMLSQAPPMQVITSMTQARPGVPMTPPTAPLPPAGQPPPSLPQLVRAPTPKTQQTNVTTIPQVSVAPSPPALIPSSSLQAPTHHVQPLTTQAQISTAPILATTTMPPPQVTCAITQVSTPLQPPSLTPMAIVTSTPSTIQPKSEIKSETNPPKITQVAPMNTQAAPPVTNTVTPMTQAQPQQTPPTLTTVNGTPPSSESGEVNDKPPQATVNGTPHPVAPLPPVTGPPKAMVKPQVLTHVIEGFVIHEASEPFPVSRSSLLTEIPKPRPPNYTNTIPVAAVTSSSAQSPIGGQAEKENLPDDEATRKKASDLTSTSPKGDTAKCEFCGKTDLRSKFKRSKRFCSTSCAKRYNVGCSKRIGLFKNPDEPPSKRLREDGTFDEMDSTPNTESVESQEMGVHMEGEEMTEGEEDGLSTPESPTKSHRVDILKWTVKDVVDFIQNLPGCKEYAEDFALQEIDGQALMLLKADHLMSAMSMKLGPALKICAKIESMRGERKET